MNDDSDRLEGATRTPARNPKQGQRQNRLKQALRENLKRRKLQAKGRGDPTPASPTPSALEPGLPGSVSCRDIEASPDHGDETRVED